ncbi:hypothetical protein ABG067_002700 [Albugo candida]|uniref:Cytochrome b-c1 complex subunit 7 n=1 Tax=Albugo candida TaxID=65357 RepID=A0A024GBR6_9STRA|nr:unnamed protein product [Albugo candida]|eukprot:CCI44213.1 unnamed protein product [Albugo candida]
MSKLIAKVAALYRKKVGESLTQYGLKYDDVLVDTPEVVTALSWLKKKDYLGRTRRIARAADCGLKRSYLTEELQQVQRPFDNYLYEKVQEAEKLQVERDALTKW